VREEALELVARDRRARRVGRVDDENHRVEVVPAELDAKRGEERREAVTA